MSSKEQLELATNRAINSYCRVIELHLKAIEQGATPEMIGPMGQTVKEAHEGLAQEVELLRFLRDDTIARAGGRDSTGRT